MLYYIFNFLLVSSNNFTLKLAIMNWRDHSLYVDVFSLLYISTTKSLNTYKNLKYRYNLFSTKEMPFVWKYLVPLTAILFGISNKHLNCIPK